MPSTRRNLVISPVGAGSVHASWLDDAEARSFDVFLVDYSDGMDAARNDADHYLRRRGFKWELIDHVLREQGDLVRRYDRIWCPDCDIRSDTRSINRLFALFERYQLQLAQPAISAGEISFQFVRQRPDVVLRYSPFVEVMCPLFTREALFRVQPTLLESRSGWGLDWLWSRIFQAGEMAVIDAVGVEHTGRLSRGENYQNLAKLGVEPGQEFERIVARHGGFNRRLHRRLVRGRIRLPAVWQPGRRGNLAARALARLGVRAQRA